MLEQHKNTVKELDMNPKLELLKIQKEKILKIQSIVKKEQMVEEIDKNIFNIDKDMKRRIKETRRRIKAIKKWKISKNSVAEFKIKDNLKNIEDHDK